MVAWAGIIGAALFGRAAAQVGSWSMYAGYEPASDVGSHSMIDLDMAEIETAVGTYATSTVWISDALFIYDVGGNGGNGNSVKGSGAIRTIEEWGFPLSIWIGLGFLVALGWPAILRSVGVFKSQRRDLFFKQLGRMTLGHGLGAVALAAAAFTLNAPMKPIFPLALAGILLSFQVLMHLSIFAVLHGLRKRGRNSRNVMILGSGPRALAAQRTIEAHPEWGYQIIGFLDDADTAFRPAVNSDKTYAFNEFPEIVRTQVVDEVLGIHISSCAAVSLLTSLESHE